MKINNFSEQMMLKILLAISVTALVQGDPLRREDQIEPRATIYDRVDDMIAQYEITMQEIMTYIEETFTGIKEHVQTTGKAIHSISNAVIRTRQSQFLGQLSDIEISGVVAGIDVSICIIFVKNLLLEMPQRYDLEIGECIQLQTEEDHRTIDQFFASVSSIKNTVEEYKEENAICRANNDQICAQVLLGKVSTHNAFIREIVDREIDVLRNQLDDMEIRFQSCASTKSDEYNLEGGLSIQRSRACADMIIIFVVTHV